MSNYDYVIVGAGSSGSALAGRLAADNKIKILLLEAGPKDHNPMLIGNLILNQKRTSMERECIGLEERFWVALAQ